MAIEELEKRLPLVAKTYSTIAFYGKASLNIELVLEALEQCLDEVERLDSSVKQLIEFGAVCVETGAGYMEEVEKWEWVARRYERFCFSHSWMPTVDYLLDKYALEHEKQENEISENSEDINDFCKPPSPKFEE
jgi:hypothetical protein